MMQNKKPALGTRAGRNERGLANVSARHVTTRDVLRQLAERAFYIARRCKRETTKRKFERLARFLETYARGGLR